MPRGPVLELFSPFYQGENLCQKFLFPPLSLPSHWPEEVPGSPHTNSGKGGQESCDRPRPVRMHLLGPASFHRNQVPLAQKRGH